MPSKETIEKLVTKTKVHLIIIAILLFIICYYNHKFIIPSILIYILIVMYSVWINDKNRVEVVKHVQELTLDVNSTVKNTLTNSPFPLVIMDTTGAIIWKGNKFTQEFANIDIKNYLNLLAKEIKQEIQNDNVKGDISKEIEIDSKIYRILGQFIKSKQDKNKEQEYILSIYFIDNTNYARALQECEELKTCIGIITVDNYEEIIQRIPNEEKPQMLASIEKAIYEWTKPTGGLVIKTERETYIYIFEQKYLKMLEEGKFSILDSIKKIKISTSIQLTLSISISTEGESDYMKYKSALVGLDIALGRGGDQAIVRKNSQYKFFGGRAQEVEKRTKVKARIISQALEELILQSKDVMIMGHANGDIDSMGSSLGIYRLAKTLGKETYIINNTFGLTLEPFITELKKDEEYKNIMLDKNQALSQISENTLLILVDTHKTNYVEVPTLLEKTEKIVVIDHHRKSTDFVENPILIFHEVYASSAAELVVEILQYSEKNIELKPIETEALYAGIMMDTKNFTFKTGVRTFEAAAYLRKFGVDIIKVKKWFQSDLENYNLIADIVKKAKVVKDSIGISNYEEINKDANLICAKAADELLSISNITASFVIGSLGDKICISGRSIGDINVQVILEKLGGGGHITTAGTQIEGMTIEQVNEKLLEKIEEYYQEMK